jgi:mannose-6-phosphate isomerase
MMYQIGDVGERPWGRWRVLEIGPSFCVKRIEVEPGHRLSLQYHHHRYEDWIVVAGTGLVQCGEELISVRSGDRVRIPILARHRMANTGSELLVIVEVQHGSILDENDIVRVEDDYAR